MSKSLAFVLLTFVLSWGLAGAFFLTGLPLKSPFGMVLGVTYMFMPALAAVIVQRRHGQRVKDLGVRWKWNRYFAVGWFSPPVLAVAALGASLLLPGVIFSPGMEGMFERFAGSLTPEQIAEMRRAVETSPIHPVWLALGQGLIAGITVNAIAAFGEELGWRGLLWEEWKNQGFWKASAMIGVIWGVWHAPLTLQGHNYPQHPVIGVGMMTLFCLLLAPLFSYVRLKSGSVLAAAIMHGTLNATGAVALMLVQGGNDLTIGMTGLAGLSVLALANLALWASLRMGWLNLKEPAPVTGPHV